MFVLYGSVEIHLPYSTSLKSKRKVINSIIDRLRKRLNLSISEVAYHDLWQRSTLGFAIVSSSIPELEKFVSYINDTLYNNYFDIEITSFNYDITGLE